MLSLRDGSAGDGFALARGEVLPPDGERGLGGQSGLLRSKSESELEESCQENHLKKDFKKQSSNYFWGNTICAFVNFRFLS